MAERCLAGVCVGTYVTNMGAASNPGTRAQPKNTINAALLIAAQLAPISSVPNPVVVYVGTGNGMSPVIFSEDISMPNRVDLQGGWSADVSGAWTRDIATFVTELRPSFAAGVRFSDSAMTRASSRMSGFTVRGPATAGTTAAMTLSSGASPTLDRLTLIGGSNAGTGYASGLTISGTSSPLANPLISSSTLTGGTGPSGAESVGLHVSTFRASFELVNSTVSAADGVATSTGIYCQSACPGAVIRMSNITGGNGTTATGLFLNGDNSGLTLDTTSIVGGSTTPGGATTGTRYGLRTTGPNGSGSCAGTAPVITGSTIAGARGSAQLAYGIHATSCDLDVRASTVMGAVPVGGPLASTVSEAYGAVCTNATSSCAFADTQLSGAASLPLGSTNATQRSQGLTFSNGATGSARRSVILSGTCTGCITVGVAVSGTPRIENSVIVSEVGSVSSAVDLFLVSSITGDAVFVNNHIQSLGATGTCRALNVFGSGVADIGGVFLNNTLLVSSGATNTRVVSEGFPVAFEPRLFANNNLFGSTVLYRDDGVDLTTISEVNAIVSGPISSNNISADPLVPGNGDWHLGATSPNRGAGATSFMSTLAPTADFDTPPDTRPLPAATAPDIGPDERL